jgi:DNA-binding CsgD family transcriptional regulator
MTPLLDQALISTRFIGRAAQLVAVDHWLAQVSAGQSQVVCVAGEAGIGKSRLVAEVRTRAEAQGWQTAQGACFEPDLLLPYAPLIDLLRTHLARRPLDEVSKLLDPWASEFVKLLPELALLMPNLQPTPRLDPEAEKRRRFDALVAFFLRVMADQNDQVERLLARSHATSGSQGAAAQGLLPPMPQPLLLIVEDLHWSDETSLEFLRYLARRLAKQPLLLLLTYRSDEIHPALHHFLAALDREQRPVEVRLPQFTPAEVDALLRSIFDLQRPVRRPFLDAVYALTEGNPFFIEEVLKVLVAGGDIFYADGQWDRKPLRELHIPRTVQDAVQRRTAQLSPAARQVLNLAAVAGRRFDFALLQAVTGQDEAALLAHIKELMAAQLVIEATPEQFAFRHALTQQAIYADLLARERKALHRMVAETLERLSWPTPHRSTNSGQSGYQAELAHHFYVSEAWAQALVYAQRAGEQAQALHAPHAAVEHFTHALAAAQRVATSTRPQPDPDMAMRLHHARGLAYETLGDFEAAQMDLEAALRLAQHAGDRVAEWQALLALGELWAARNYGQTGQYLRQALALAERLDQPVILARSLNRMGNWHLNVEQYSEALRHHHAALAIFQAANDEQGLAVTFDLLGATYLMFGDHVQSVAHLEQAAVRFRRLADRRSLASTLAVLTARNEIYTVEHVVSTAPGAAASIRDAEEALQLAREIGWRSGEAYALIVLSRVVVVTGDYKHALTVTQQGYAIAREIEHKQWCCQAHFSFGIIALDLLAFAGAQHHFAQALALGVQSGSVFLLRAAHTLLALSYLHQHNFSRAEDALNVAAEANHPPDSLSGQMIWLVRAELALARGHAALALDQVEQLIAALPNIALVGERGVPGLALLRGKALAALAQPAEAEAALHLALAGAADKGISSLRWRTQVTLGHFYAAQGRQSAAEGAFAAARAIINELAGQIPDEAFDLVESGSLRAHFLAQTAALFPPPPRRTPRQAAKQAFDGLTAREVDVALQIAQGKANREIAEMLVVSERTVETHVGNILGKLGFASRRQIADWVAEKGVV